MPNLSARDGSFTTTQAMRVTMVGGNRACLFLACHHCGEEGNAVMRVWGSRVNWEYNFQDTNDDRTKYFCVFVGSRVNCTDIFQITSKDVEFASDETQFSLP